MRRMTLGVAIALAAMTGCEASKAAPDAGQAAPPAATEPERFVRPDEPAPLVIARKLAKVRRDSEALLEEGTAKMQSDPARARECLEEVVRAMPQADGLHQRARQRLDELARAP